MRKNIRPLVAASIAFCALFFCLCPGKITRTASAQSHGALRAHASTGTHGKKISSDLSELLSGALTGDEPIRIILQGREDTGGNLRSLLQRNGVKVRGHFRNLDTRVVEVPASMIAELAADPDVSYLSPDREVQSFGHVSVTTGADAVRAASVPGTTSALDGSGVGIAVLDSGIYTGHLSFRGKDGLTSRVAVSVDFIGAKRMDLADTFGHGTHVAGLAAGNSALYSSGYTGIAPNSKLINLAVLNKEGKGNTS